MKRTIEEILEDNKEFLMTIDGVIGVAIGLCQEQKCIKVQIERDDQSLRNKIPQEIEGFPVSILIMDRPQLFNGDKEK
ncbi:MAG: hypothetical protein GXO93_04740 [FCB group bacterium]|nr:hypothetical protein [FCB group bacterium]